MRENKNGESFFLSGAFIPTLLVGLIGMGISSFFAGLNGFSAALLAQFVVLIYFLINFLVFKLSSTMEPRATMALALFSYFSKLLLLAIFLFGITSFISPELFNRTVFGINAIVLTITWLIGEVRKFLRLKNHLPLPKSIPKE